MSSDPAAGKVHFGSLSQRLGRVEGRLAPVKPGVWITDVPGRDLAIAAMLASAIESRTKRPGDHAERVAARAMSLLRALAPGAAHDDIRLGFLLHDVGQITVPESVLLKAGPLDEAERDLVRAHPESGAQMVKGLGLARAAIEVIRYHHERFDGSGYPKGLAGEKIPLAARVFSVVDAYDALTNPRPYRRATDHDCAVAELRRMAGTQFDPRVVETFVAQSRALGLV